MNITRKWKVKHSAVLPLAGSTRGITAWGVYVDGCLSRVIEPHIRACLVLMGLTAEEISHGKASPFSTVVNYPSSPRPEAMRTFGELLAERNIRGQYCDEAGRAMFIQYNQLTNITNVVRTQTSSYEIEVVGQQSLSLGNLTSGVAFCEDIRRPDDRRLAFLTVSARNVKELGERLRLVGNIGALRWNPNDQQMLDLLGKPLL